MIWRRETESSRKMEVFFQWVKQIVSYLVFVAVLMGILPTEKYEKYIRLFAGCVLILLVFQPLTGSLRLDEQISRLFEEFSVRNEAGELRGDLGRMEKMRLERLLDGYEQAAAEEAIRMAQAEGFEVVSASVELNRQEASMSFGKVEQVWLQVGKSPDAVSDREGGRKSEEEAWKEIEISVAPILSERVSEASSQKESDSEAPDPELPDWGTEKKQEKENRGESVRISELRRRVAAYYRVEEDHVEIRVEAGPGMDPEK